MFVVSIYANRKPECFAAEPDECVDVITSMTGISVQKAKEYLTRAMLVKRLRVLGPFELAIDYGDDDCEPVIMLEYEPGQGGDRDDDV
ncbi:hypothetical protein EOS93_23185 [Rhizobium sp. RMa-01]|uniref:hypothetical protein n=1 Tax=unclassified Rhizobium TaxID=2613769 RepID=UPI0008DA95AD|nr:MULTISPECIES: hypothetical protein [unclassified Rhizobium]OHV21426.1 hypothetical protein BBJ66_31180 [Rhizobium sp. RSm-3]RVU08817.1 hypothetical protein EOS93_23185 [Rhizobium sp. RMa-01]